MDKQSLPAVDKLAVQLRHRIGASATAWGLSQTREVDVAAWWSTRGIGSALETTGAAALAAAFYSILGGLLGTATASPARALTAGLGWLMIAEPALSAVSRSAWDTDLGWLPGEAVRELIWQPGLAPALLVLVWASATLLVSVAAFQRGDTRLA